MPAIYLEKSISHRARRAIIDILLVLSVIALLFSSGLFIEVESGVTGLFFLLIFAASIFIAIDSFYYSLFFRENEEKYLFELTMMSLSGKDSDATKAFILSKFGSKILYRLGVESNSVADFLNSRKNVISKESLQFGGGVTVESYFEALLNADTEFKNFLSLHGATLEIIVHTAKLVFSLDRVIVNKERWWSSNNLRNIKAIGTDWAYGAAYTLSRWSSPLQFSASLNDELHEKEIISLENILSKSKGTNVLLVGEEGSGKMEVLEGLGRKIERGSSSTLRNKKILVLDGSGFAAYANEKSAFEKLLIELLIDAQHAGNIILVIPDFPALIRDGLALGIDIQSLLNPYLSASNIQLVGVSDEAEFHKIIEPNQSITTHFETLAVKSEGVDKILSIFEDEILELEGREGVTYSYPALFEAVTDAERYFVGSSLFARAQELLTESASKARSLGRGVVLPEDILSLIKTKTGTPTGVIDSIEKEKLLNLETMLHERVIGQNEAIKSISDALRRARAGIANPKRPMGSFLFLGPTGVGKTETTKALGEIFFGQNAKILRLDMSEYNTPDALNRLIGSFDSGTPGVLTSMIRENQYGVLLLDEFEKTDRKVLDLFLQILDEGIFSDVQGRRVSARNLIVIATSNAGSQNIFETVQAGKDLASSKDAIIESIVREGIYKPELLNRFDGVILFHPLTESDLKEVAKIMLKRLEWRLKERNITLVVNDALVQFLVKKGSDPKFGARPLNRAIQDTVEKIVADRIIAGTLTPGSSLELTDADLV